MTNPSHSYSSVVALYKFLNLNTILSNYCSIHYTSTKSKIIFICILMEFELKQNFVTSLFI